MIATDDLDPDDKTSRRIQLPSRDQITAIQINTLTHVIQSLSNIRTLADENGGVRDGGTVCAVETSIINACAQLDNVLQDSSRWNLSQLNNLESLLSTVYKTHISVMEEQKKQLRLTSAPHRIAAPKLAKLGTGLWAAIKGDPNHLDQCIMGVGETPAAAIEDFDNVFNGLVKQAEEEKHEDNPTVDGGADRKPENPASNSETDVRGNRPATGSDIGELPPQV